MIELYFKLIKCKQVFEIIRIISVLILDLKVIAVQRYIAIPIGVVPSSSINAKSCSEIL